MSRDEPENSRDFWNFGTDGWWHQPGDDGDSNQILNSDFVLWEFAGDVSGLRVLDAISWLRDRLPTLRPSRGPLLLQCACAGAKEVRA